MANDNLRQRLVGAVVLICAGIVIWSVLLTGPVNPSIDTRTQIPPPPAIETRDVPAPQRPEVPPVEPAPIARTALQIPAEQPAAERDAGDSHLDEAGLPVAWVLQVASLSSDDNAEALKEKLQAAGYKAYTEKTHSQEGETTRVLVGPKLSRAQALELKQTIDEAYGVDALVYRFTP